jgi:hypothetical protein
MKKQALSTSPSRCKDGKRRVPRGGLAVNQLLAATPLKRRNFGGFGLFHRNAITGINSQAGRGGFRKTAVCVREKYTKFSCSCVSRAVMEERARKKVCGMNCMLPGALLLAPHTSGPRDVPRWGALSLLQKDAALQGGIQQKPL